MPFQFASRKRVVGFTALTALTALHILIRSASAAIDFRTVAVTGRHAPGTPAGVNFSQMGRPTAISDTGQVGVYAQVSGPGVTTSNDAGFWSGTPGSLGLIVRHADPAPGTSSNFSFLFNDITPVNDYGQVSFASTLPPTLSHSLWVGSPGSPQLVAKDGDPAPGTPAGVVYSSVGQSAPMNEVGQILFGGSLSGPGVDSTNQLGLFVGVPGSVQMVVRDGDTAPGAGSGVTMRTISLGGINRLGQTTLVATLSGTGVTSQNNSSIYTGGAGSLHLVARTNDPAPGSSAGGHFTAFTGPPAINRNGDVAFIAQSTGFTGGGSGVWSTVGGVLQLIALQGDHPAGAASGVNIGDLRSGGKPMLNAASQIAFQAALGGISVPPGGNSDTGIVTAAPGGSRLVAREGDHAPGTPAGVNFADLHNGFSNPALNGLGQVAFWSPLTGTGVTSTNDAGIWYTDPAGTLNLLAREGDLFDVDDGPGVSLRTISSLTLATQSSGEDGQTAGFNRSSQLAITLSFTDGSTGIFIAQVPEPASASFILLVSVGSAALRRARRPITESSQPIR